MKRCCKLSLKGLEFPLQAVGTTQRGQQRLGSGCTEHRPESTHLGPCQFLLHRSVLGLHMTRELEVVDSVFVAAEHFLWGAKYELRVTALAS